MPRAAVKSLSAPSIRRVERRPAASRSRRSLHRSGVRSESSDGRERAARLPLLTWTGPLWTGPSGPVCAPPPSAHFLLVRFFFRSRSRVGDHELRDLRHRRERSDRKREREREGGASRALTPRSVRGRGCPAPTQKECLDRRGRPGRPAQRNTAARLHPVRSPAGCLFPTW